MTRKTTINPKIEVPNISTIGEAESGGCTPTNLKKEAHKISKTKIAMKNKMAYPRAGRKENFEKANLSK